MAFIFIVFVGVVYLFSHYSTSLAFKSFEFTTVQPGLLIDGINNSTPLLSLTYKSGSGSSFPSLSFKSRIKAKFPTHRPEVVVTVTAKQQNAVSSTTLVPPIIRPQMILSPLSLSPFLPTLHSQLISATSSATSPQPAYLQSNQTIFSPSYISRILPPSRDFKSQQQQLPVLITTTSTVRPKASLTKGYVPILSNNATSLPNDDYSIEAVIPVNLSAHFKFVNSQQQQRVVLNNIQEIINSLKSQEQFQMANTSATDSGGDSKYANQTFVSGKKGSFTAFKLRLLEKLRQHQSLMKGKNSLPSNNSTKEMTVLQSGQTASKKKPENIQQLINGSSTLTIKSSSVAPGNFFKVDNYTLPKRGHKHHNHRNFHHHTPSVLNNRTQNWQVVEPLLTGKSEKIDRRSKPHKQASLKYSNAHESSQQKLNAKIPKSGRREEAEEGQFMVHLKDYLSKLVDGDKKKPSSPSTHLQMIIRSPVASAAGPTAYSEPDRIDYGEVERILAYVNPYGRRISMPVNTEYSSSLTAAESRNVRMQRSTGNSEESDEALSSLWKHMASLNLSQSEPLTTDENQEKWLNTLLEEYNNKTQEQQDSDSKTSKNSNSTSGDPFDFISFPSIDSNYSKEVKTSNDDENDDDVYYSSKANSDFKPNRIFKYGMRNTDNRTQTPSQNVTFGEWNEMHSSGKPGNEKSKLKVMTISDKESTKHSDQLLPPINANQIRHIARHKTINYDPKESEFTYFPRERFVGTEQYRQLENASDFFSDVNQDWVAYFEQLQRKMNLDRSGVERSNIGKRVTIENGHRQSLPFYVQEETGNRFQMNLPYSNDQPAVESFEGITGSLGMPTTHLPSRIPILSSLAATSQLSTKKTLSPKIISEKASVLPSFEEAKNTRKNVINAESTGKAKQSQPTFVPMKKAVHQSQMIVRPPLSSKRVNIFPGRSYEYRLNNQPLPPLLSSMSDPVQYGPPAHPYQLSSVIQYSNRPYKIFPAAPLSPIYHHNYYLHSNSPYGHF